MAKSPLFKKLHERVRGLGTRAVDELLASEERGDALGAAVRRVQDGRRVLDEGGARILGALGLATRGDLERLSRRIGRLRKRLTALRDRLGEP